MKICFIEQPSGLGDILLGSKIAHHFAQMGHRVIWPISHTYNYFNDYIKVEGVEFVDIESDFEYKKEFMQFCLYELKEVYEGPKFIHVPTRRSFFSKAGQHISQYDSHDAANMHGKFAMCSLTHDNWQDYFTLKRNEEREEKLFNHLQLNAPYHLVNKNFGTPPQWKEILNKQINVPAHYKRVDMFMDPQFLLFDWLQVFEKADRIDTVSTSTFYLFEKIELKCVPTIYSRNNPERSYEENFSWLQRLARKDYLFIS